MEKGWPMKDFCLMCHQQLGMTKGQSCFSTTLSSVDGGLDILLGGDEQQWARVREKLNDISYSDHWCSRCKTSTVQYCNGRIPKAAQPLLNAHEAAAAGTKAQAVTTGDTVRVLWEDNEPWLAVVIDVPSTRRRDRSNRDKWRLKYLDKSTEWIDLRDPTVEWNLELGEEAAEGGGEDSHGDVGGADGDGSGSESDDAGDDVESMSTVPVVGMRSRRGGTPAPPPAPVANNFPPMC